MNSKKYDSQNGYYLNQYGGQYVPEILLPALDELEEAFEEIKTDTKFLAEYEYYLKYFAGRPSPLFYAENLSKKLGGGQILIKNEGQNFTGSHKINHCIFHALLAKKLNKTRIICETGAGQHGLACATVCAQFGLECTVYMGQKDIDKQYPNVFWMKQLGAKLIPVTSGQQKLTEATEAAIGAWISDPEAYLMIGSVMGPHPYPEVVRFAQNVISKESKSQIRELLDTKLKHLGRDNYLPDYIIACIGGGSNAIGSFEEYLYEDSVNLIGVEAGGTDLNTIGKNSSRIANGKAKEGIFEGFKSLFLLDKDGQIEPVGGISAGLGYAGIGPIHAALHQDVRLQVTSASDQEVIEAFQMLAKEEGILGALESCHALAEAIKLAPTLNQDQIIIINLSGRADNYLFNVAGALKDDGFKDFCRRFGHEQN